MSVALMGAGSGGKLKELHKCKRNLLWSDTSSNKQGETTLTWNQEKDYQIYYIVTKKYYNSNASETNGQYVILNQRTMAQFNADDILCRWITISKGRASLSYSGKLASWKIVDSSDGHDEWCKIFQIYGVEGTEM